MSCHSTKSCSFADAVARIGDNAVVSVSGSSGLACPDATLAALGKRFAESANPRNLTMLHPIAAGDMYGIKGIDHLAQKGLLGRILVGSMPSGPSSLPMPKIWQMVCNDDIAAYNIPSGILFDMHRQHAGPGVLTKVGLDTFVDPDVEGCAMNAQARQQPIVAKVSFAGESWLHFANIAIDVAIIRATTADENGNLSCEHEGAIMGILEQAIAAKNNRGVVIAQVKRIVRHGSIPARQVVVPGNLVDCIVVDEKQLQATGIAYDPSISGEIRLPWQHFAALEMQAEKVICRRAARELSRGMAVNLGFGISANVPLILHEEDSAQEITWVIEQGAVGGIPLSGFAFGCSANADAIVASPHQFAYFQGGGFDLAMLSFLQIDGDGNINVSRLNSKPYLTAGCGGFVDITHNARAIVFSGFFTVGAKLSVSNGALKILAEGKPAKFVQQVDQISFSGRQARQKGQRIVIVTERCVLRTTDNGLEISEVAAGIDLEKDIQNLCPFPLAVSNSLQTMDATLFSEKNYQWRTGQ